MRWVTVSLVPVWLHAGGEIASIRTVRTGVKGLSIKAISDRRGRDGRCGLLALVPAISIRCGRLGAAKGGGAPAKMTGRRGVSSF
jgi:hypothetical protein